MKSLLFNPNITKLSLLGGLSAIGAYSYQIQQAFGVRGLVFCIVVAVLLGMCATGRSTVSAVDNYNPQNGPQGED